jgi:hypothetical protein
MLKELEDYIWFPKLLRRWQMDFIGSLPIWANIYAPLTTILQQLISSTNVTCMHDVCSGSGKPSLCMQNMLLKKIPLTLSDKFPDDKYTNLHINYTKHSVDIATLIPKKNTCYTMYNAFHHFSDNEQKRIVQNMAMANAPFLFAEILQPNWLNIVKIIFTTTFVQLLVTPFLKPFSLARLFFTYIIPINIFTITYDGIISVFKSKTATQFTTLLNDVSTSNYHIIVKSIKSKAATIIYTMGQPIN